MVAGIAGYGAKKAAKKVAAKLKPKPTAAQAAKAATRAKNLKRMEGHETSNAFSQVPQKKDYSPRQIREGIERDIKSVRADAKKAVEGKSKVRQSGEIAATGGVAAAGAAAASKKERGRGAKK